MANFSVSLSFQTIGLCEKLRVTDVSDYLTNTEGYTISDVSFKNFIVRNGVGTILYQEIAALNTKMVFEVPISLLTLNISVELGVYLGAPINQGYGSTNALIVACLGI